MIGQHERDALIFDFMAHTNTESPDNCEKVAGDTNKPSILFIRKCYVDWEIQNATVVYHKVGCAPIVFSEKTTFSGDNKDIHAFKNYLNNPEVWKDHYRNFDKYPLDAFDVTQQDTLEEAIKSCKMEIFDFIGETVEQEDMSHKIVHIYVNLPIADDDKVENDERVESIRSADNTQLLDQYGRQAYTKKIVKFASNYVKGRNEILEFSENGIDLIEDGKYYQPESKNFPSIDSIIAPDKLFQMTIAKCHPIKMNGFKKLYNKLGDENEISFYFVVPAHLHTCMKICLED
ncbi:hypothetical protein C1646_758035 [Rhizophagus diaphanus]|nr:hypothetical protein C1646_758035 [Rhizophagus diaphanus] [Rhizophagus sp. MUCL 43196]